MSEQKYEAEDVKILNAYLHKSKYCIHCGDSYLRLIFNKIILIKNKNLDLQYKNKNEKKKAKIS